MAIQLFLLHFVMMPSRCQPGIQWCSGVVMTWSLGNRIYQIWSDWYLSLSVEFLRGILMYTYAYLRCVLWGIRTVTLFWCHDGRTHRQKHFADRVLSAGVTLTDSSKEITPTKRGDAGVIADEDSMREGRCGGDSTQPFSGGAAWRRLPRWCRCRSRGLRTRTNTPFRRFR